MQMIGRHNLENARCAALLCHELGLDMSQVLHSIQQFKGIERRLEVAGCVDGITVIDDYAHNPAKISAALTAVSEICAQVHAYWRPHGFTPLQQAMDELTGVFTMHWKTNGGSIFILPVFYAGGTVERKATAEELVERLNSAGVPVVYVPDYDTLKQELESRAADGDAILGMGARDPRLPLFAKQLVTEWKISRP
jgi:UDP-N-acetylmuramate--alanine ligase